MRKENPEGRGHCSVIFRRSLNLCHNLCRNITMIIVTDWMLSMYRFLQQGQWSISYSNTSIWVHWRFEMTKVLITWFIWNSCKLISPLKVIYIPVVLILSFLHFGLSPIFVLVKSIRFSYNCKYSHFSSDAPVRFLPGWIRYCLLSMFSFKQLITCPSNVFLAKKH